MGKEPKAKERARAAKDTTPTKAARETYGSALSSVLAPGKRSLGRDDGGATTVIERGRGASLVRPIAPVSAPDDLIHNLRTHAKGSHQALCRKVSKSLQNFAINHCVGNSLPVLYKTRA